ncbi:TetR/AcrR family transcriptional regulator [Goodfellowiella coeruleoviolacea]|uniref:Transcriptional regulator, TetR family n=1 Tax=Goodfellowiella coeruleoviolacea TaxID=334858 RepID=A0AAE3GGT8_9PSEU|nr:TetR family transcriptional regulator [Goodfellowiella coeruleoviolacea]MCP2167039.1 transcriptional regulator, TetR family [Goodfellowiella coeruleoviolacea]
MVAFQRARSAEQREVRRAAILDTTAAMLAEMPVSAVALNELSRRVGLAKSNVLRYFESREAILLELLDRAWQRWLTELDERLAREVDPHGTPRQRGDRFAEVLAGSLRPHPVLCDLCSAHTSVLEHNVSVGVAARSKRATLDNITTLAGLARRHLPELGADDARKLAGAAVLLIGALWTSTHPSASMLAAYETDPALAALRLDFTTALAESVAILISGILSRA